ncbi:ABC transporter substrate-binding protein [Aromatoleum toluclasticum]|uniref:ABC transporter substrate-binding protein n=1 Tax=Aromatoleum toluclasticum TaxID=92003 RepID=UPI001E5D02AA|nr:ABC transporter substrate binding protein [Aromatoleum toluclasticum]
MQRSRDGPAEAPMLQLDHRLLRTLLLALAILAVCCGRAFAGSRVVVVTAERSGAHEETLVALRTALAPDVPEGDMEVLGLRELDRETLADARIVVTIGTQAAKAVGARMPAVPVLYTLIPRDAFDLIQYGPHADRYSAIFLDQPVHRQIALLNIALPHKPNLALLASPASNDLARRLAAVAREQQLPATIEKISTADEIYPALERLLAEPAVLLALPDSTLFNSYTIQNVLLTSYRHRAPLVGFSPAYVRAGALLALYSTPAQIARQAADAVRRVLAGGGLPPPQSPREFEVATNPNVARSLSIGLDSAERIAARLRQREGRPEVKP